MSTQPDQLVEEALELAAALEKDRPGSWAAASLRALVAKNRALAIALSECRERERKLVDVEKAAKDVLDYASTPRRAALRKLRTAVDALAAQPPSEADEGSAE